MKSLKYQVKRIVKSFIYRWPLGKQFSQPVLVYQMGKVASMSTYTSLKKVPGIDVSHVHRLNPENIAKVQESYRQQGHKPPNEEKALYLSENLLRTRKIPVKIITLVREPIARNISAYFQNLEHFEDMKNPHDSLDVAELIGGFLNKYAHDVPLKWFDIEMLSTTGIDVYQYKFPKEEGYQVIDAPPYSLLIMKHDLDDSLKEKYIGQFLGIESFCMIRANEAFSKEYAKQYKAFISSIKLPNEYIERMLTSKYAQHFYSAEELSNISKKWTRG